MIVMYNHSYEDYHIKKGDKIAQLICEMCLQPIIKSLPYEDKEEKDNNNNLSSLNINNTSRGEKGFGSTGY